MPDPTDAEQEIARLQEQVAALKAQLQGSGGLAQGAGNVAAGERGLAAGRDINIWNPPPADAGEEDLRCAYLHRLVYLTRPLALSGVDPALASGDRDARLSLDAVYTALLTFSSAEEQLIGAPPLPSSTAISVSYSWEIPAVARRPSPTSSPCVWPERRWVCRTPTWNS